MHLQPKRLQGSRKVLVQEYETKGLDHNFFRAYIKDLEKIRPSTIIDIIHSGEQLVVGDKAKARLPEQQTCSQCGYISSQEICKVRQVWLVT